MLNATVRLGGGGVGGGTAPQSDLHATFRGEPEGADLHATMRTDLHATMRADPASDLHATIHATTMAPNVPGGQREVLRKKSRANLMASFGRGGQKRV